jgi:hypothetical protein
MKKYLPPCERELTSFPPCSSESLDSMDGTCTIPHASAGTEMFQGYFILFYFIQKKFNPPLPRRLLCGGGGIGTRQSLQPTHVIELNSSIGILLPSYSREIRSRGRGGGCSMSIQPTSGWSCRVRRHPRRGRGYGLWQHSYLVRKHLGSKLKSNLSECSYLHSSLRCRIHTSLPR